MIAVRQFRQQSEQEGATTAMVALLVQMAARIADAVGAMLGHTDMWQIGMLIGIGAVGM